MRAERRPARRGARVAAAAPRGPGGAARRAADGRARRPDAARRGRGRRRRALAGRRRARAARRRPPRRAAAGDRNARPPLARGRGARRDDPPAARPRLDLGGSAKGLAADWAASRLRGRYVVDCGGDLRVGGTHDVALRGTAHTLRVTDGAVATSGIDRRVWRADGRYAHHLLDPGTGEPAWTGVSRRPRSAPTALEAEALAKAALLPARAARGGPGRGGVIVVGDDGRAEARPPGAAARSAVAA